MSWLLEKGPLAGAEASVVEALTRRGVTRRFAASDILIRQGEPSRSLFYVVSGTVRVELNSLELTAPVMLAEIRAGEFVGEMGALDGRPRSATVCAITSTCAVEIATEDALEVIAQHPSLALRVLRVLTGRLRATDARVAPMGAFAP